MMNITDKTVSLHKTGITVTLSLAMLLASLGTSIANIALPTLVQAFMAPFDQVQAVVVVYLVALTLSTVIAGSLGDRFGLKRVLVMGLMLFAVACLLCAVMPDLRLLVGARALQGVGAAFLMTLSMALMRQVAGSADIGRAMGILGTVSALGTALGPSLGGLLLPLTGWRGVFWIQVPLAVLTIILAVTALPDEAVKRKPAGSGLKTPLSRKIISSLFVNMLVAAVMMTTLVVGPFFLSSGLGMNSVYVGLVMTIGPVISIFSGIPSGRLVDRLGSRLIVAAGISLLAAGTFLMAGLPQIMGVPGYIISLAVLTPGYQLFQAANNTAVLSDVRDDRRGTISGMLSFSRNVGLIAGASAMGAVFAHQVGTHDFTLASAEAIRDGMRGTFLLAGVLMLVAVAVVFLSLFNRDFNRP
ncbi:MFS transporter [Salmonella enterica]|nr:MFS transporter [Salmonella enterica]